MAGIKDVAEKSGVSISTVSYVMSGKRSVRDDTKRKVIEAARSLGYRPKHVEHMDQSIAGRGRWRFAWHAERASSD